MKKKQKQEEDKEEDIKKLLVFAPAKYWRGSSYYEKISLHSTDEDEVVRGRNGITLKEIFIYIWKIVLKLPVKA